MYKFIFKFLYLKKIDIKVSHSIYSLFSTHATYFTFLTKTNKLFWTQLRTKPLGDVKTWGRLIQRPQTCKS